MDDETFDDGTPSTPLPPDDRLWRHPTELRAPAVGSIGAPKEGPSNAIGGGRLVAIALLAGLSASLLTYGGLAATGSLGRDTTREVVVREAATNVSTQTSVARSTSSSDIVAIARETSPAIVRVEVSGATSASGSGVVFRSDGYVMTNQHVVDGASDVIVVLADGTEASASVVGGDALTDIAVVKIDGDGSYPTAVLGSATGLQVGQTAVAIGSPLALSGGASVSVGVVSALGRRVQTEDGVLLDMIQTDAAINPGSSGGALLDGNGNVIGITTAVAVSDVGAEGLGFATPIDVARSVADELIVTGSVRHAWIGISGRDLSSDQADELGVDGGAVVESVTADSPAWAAELAEGDIVLEVDGRPVTSMAALAVTMRSYRPGDEIEIVVARDGQRRTSQLKLAERPATVDG